MEFLRKLLADLEAVTPDRYRDHGKPVDEGDVMLGEMDDELKVLFTLTDEADDVVRDLHRQMKEKALSLITSDDVDKIDLQKVKELLGEDFALRHAEAHRRHEILRKIFWAEVTKRFSTEGTGKDTVAIRQGFKVVAYDEPRDPMEELLDGLGGHIVIATEIPSFLVGRRRG